MSTLNAAGLSNLLERLSVMDASTDIHRADVLMNPLDVCRTSLATLLAELVNCEVSDAYKSIQWPNNIFNGDLSVPLPKFFPGREAAESSSEVVDKVMESAQSMKTWSAELEIVPRLLLPYIIDRNDHYGPGAQISPETTRKQKLVVEFSSPNITVDFHGKYLRSTIIGAFIGRLYESMGWDVTRMNYLGDWGKPIALLYVGWKRFGSEDLFSSDPVGHMLDVYRKIEELFQPEQAASKQARDDAAKEGKDEGEAQLEIESKGIYAERNEASTKLEEGDEEVVAFSNRIRQAVIDNYQRFYDRLGIRFDDYSGESKVSPAAMTEVEQMLKDKGISEESAGAWMVDMKKLGAKAGHAILRDRTGSALYLLRDLAAVFERSKKYSFDKMIYVAGSGNNPHFSQLLKIVEALDRDLASKLQHVKFNDASKMAAVLGKGYQPQGILDKCEEAMTTLPEVDADKSSLIGGSKQTMKGLATSALIVQELSTRLGSAHAFDATTLASFKLGSGPDLQYWYTKISSLLAGHTVELALSEEEFDALAEEDQANFLRTLAQYPEVLKATYQSLEPSGIVTYLANIVEQLPECLGEEDEVEITPGLVALLEASRIVLGNGMKMLGLVPIFDLPQERADTPVTG